MMAKILLVYANSFMDNLIPIGISLLSACLKRAGHETILFDTTFYRTKEKTGDEVRVKTLQVKETNLAQYGICEKKTDMIEDFRNLAYEFNPDIIAVSAVEVTYLIGLDLLKSVKDHPALKVFGGMHGRTSFSEVIEEEAVDVVCLGEGEESFVELVNRVQNNVGYFDIPNLWVKKNGEIIRNPVGGLVNLDTLPMQDWSIYEKERFLKPMGGKVWVCGSVELDRGCVYRCAFCSNAYLQDMYKRKASYRRERSVSNFIEELLLKQERYGLTYLFLGSENLLGTSDKRFDEFIERYKEVRLPFWTQTRPESVTLKKINDLQEIGCEGISIGIEHGNEDFRRETLNRFVPNKKIIEAFEILKKSGIRVCTNSILGFPGETRELFFETVALNRELSPDNCIINIFCPYRGTRLRELCIEKGYIAENSLAGDYRSDILLDMPLLRKEEVKGLRRTFPLYVNLPQDRWSEIREAEKNDKMFERLSIEFKESYL